MRFVEDGPDIPLETVHAHEEGTLVLFCGAGVSIPAGLPDFKGLVDRTYGELRESPDDVERAELSFERPQYDRVFSLLERRFPPQVVRRAVQNIVRTPENALLDTHRAILDLATGRDGRVHLVTTNFDGLFGQARSGVPIDTAPTLPVPKKPKWNSLVHLHGRLRDSDPDGTQLVLTSADFGLAYLVERWASRFVTELFRNFAVLFVGYGVGDPVIRYLLDALEAERQVDARVGRAYALVGSALADRDETERMWRGKNVIPIWYDESNDHRLLAKTLQTWARIHKGGATSKLTIVKEVGPKDPSTLPNHEIEQLCWAMSEPTAAFASEFARLEPVPPLGWLAVFEQNHVLENSRRDVRQPAPPIAGSWATCAASGPLDQVSRQIGLWLLRHGSEPGLIRWVLEKGCALHPDVGRAFLLESMADRWPEYAKQFWQVLLGGRVCRGDRDMHAWNLAKRLHTEDWSMALRGELLHALEPCLMVRDTLRRFFPEYQLQPPGRLRDLVDVECNVSAGASAPELLDRVRARIDRDAVLADLAFDATSRLRAAVDLLAAGDREDRSDLEYPSIEEHEQNHVFQGWMHLIELTRDAFRALHSRDVKRAEALVEAWTGMGVAVFRRLVLWAARTLATPSSQRALALVLSEPDDYLWATETQVELYPFLPLLWAGLDDARREELTRAVLTGPRRELFRQEVEESEIREVQDKMIWERLVRLGRLNPPTSQAARARLETIQQAHPAWKFNGTRQEDFPSWVEVRTGVDTDYTADMLLALESPARFAVLVESGWMREGRLDAWERAVQKNPEEGLSFLQYLGTEGKDDPLVWRSTLRALESATDSRLRFSVLAEVAKMPIQVLQTCAFPLADILRTYAKEAEADLQAKVLEVWVPVFSAVQEEGR